jgi:hypothetical protein
LKVLIVRGGIYHWQSFQFEDQTQRDKYFIALNCEIDSEPFWLVLPTSQYEKHYQGKPQRLVDTLVLEPLESQHFSKKTIIDLKNLKDVCPNELQNAIKQQKVSYVGLLEETILERLEQTIENALTLSPALIDQLLCR